MNELAIGTPLVEAMNGDNFINVQAGSNGGQTGKMTAAMGYHVSTMQGGSAGGIPPTNTLAPNAAPTQTR